MKAGYLLPCIDCRVVVRAEKLRCPACHRAMVRKAILIGAALVACTVLSIIL